LPGAEAASPGAAALMSTLKRVLRAL